jgi:hypothetical protein
MNHKFLRIMILLAVVWGVTAFTWAFYPFQNPRESEDFLLSLDAFPGEWESERYEDIALPSEQFEFQASKASQGYVSTSNPLPDDDQIHAGHYVRSFPSFTLANKDYARNIEGWFGDGYGGTEWTDVELMGYPSHADEYQQGCATLPKYGLYDDSVEVCVVIARYGQHVSVFRIAKDLVQMTYADVNTLFAEIDNNFSSTPVP